MSGATTLVVEGRAWVVGDEVNTDDMYPGHAMKLPREEAALHVLSASRPGWAAQVRPGDVLIGGKRFGIGSSRPVAPLLRQLGIGCLIAEQVNSLFFRNTLNFGLPILQMPDVTAQVREGALVRVDIAAAALTDLDSNVEVRGGLLPEFLLDVLRAGGLVPRLEVAGHLLTR